MPIPSASRYPLESFDPRLKDIWLTAVRQPVEMTFENSKTAIKFQNRLQQYRAALKRERPEEARLLYRAKCSRSGNTLLITKQDAEFADVLSQLDNQLLAHTPPEGETPGPLGPSATPIPESSVPPPAAVPLSDLFADIPITHAQEGDDE